MAIDLAVNHLGLETALIDRLKAQVSGLAEVGGAYEYDLAARPQPGDEATLPAAYVLFDGTAPVENGSLPAMQAEQGWRVLLFVRPDPPSKTDSAQKAGPLLARILAALQGWRPEGRHDPLLLDGVEMAISAAGIVIFDIGWRAYLPMPAACTYD